MFEGLFNSPFGSSNTTKATLDGSDVRYTVMFVSDDKGRACAFICSVYHAGSSEVVASSAIMSGDKIRTF